MKVGTLTFDGVGAYSSTGLSGRSSAPTNPFTATPIVAYAAQKLDAQENEGQEWKLNVHVLHVSSQFGYT
jgi:hypothetical protein